MNAKMMAFVTTAVAVVAGIYVYNEFIAEKTTDSSSSGSTEDNMFAGRRRRR